MAVNNDAWKRSVRSAEKKWLAKHSLRDLMEDRGDPGLLAILKMDRYIKDNEKAMVDTGDEAYYDRSALIEFITKRGYPLDS